MNRRNLLLSVVLLGIAALHFASVPMTIWEYDEQLYALGIERYEPLLHHPPPPGAPVYIAFSKVLATLTDPFHAMLATSILAVVAGLVVFPFAFREVCGDACTGLVATALLYGSPAVLISGTLPQADSGALTLFGVAILACARMFRTNASATAAALAGLTCALCVGWRPQFSIAVVPMFLAAILLSKGWRTRLFALGTFGLVCLAWLVPMVLATGGLSSFWGWMSGQAAYFAQHDAALSRSGQSAAQIGLRFVAHPWGPKVLSIPLLIAAGIGGWFTFRRANINIRPQATAETGEPARGTAAFRLIPLAAGCLAYLAFGLATMDPADAVRYAIPSLPLTALLAGVALARIPLALLLAPAYAAGAYWYASPVLRTRATTTSPPVAAAEWIVANAPSNAVIVADRPLRPHASHLLRDFAKAGSTDVEVSLPLFLYADGERGDAPGATFRWPDTDAYRKLTRRHYGAVSAIPVPPEERFRVVEGIHPPERTREGASWRWVARRGVLELPDIGATHVTLFFRATPEYPFARNVVRIRSGTRESIVTIRRGEMATASIPIDPAARRITIAAQQSFVPAAIPGANNRDPRTLSVMLTRVRQTSTAPADRP